MGVTAEYPVISKIYLYNSGYDASQLGGYGATQLHGDGATLLHGYAVNPNTDTYPNTKPKP